MNTIQKNTHNSQLLSKELKVKVQQQLTQNGWVLLRGYETNLARFSDLLQQFTDKLTSDPARSFFDGVSQKVDAGTEAVGLHIENGNTPFPPKLVAFYSAKSACSGSQTTLCDGVELFKAMPQTMKEQWQRQVTVTRLLPSSLWRQYVKEQHPAVNDISEVNESHLNDLIAINSNQRGVIDESDCLHYELDISPCIDVSQKYGDGQNLDANKAQSIKNIAFANAILGPSFNYQKPKYTFENGEKVNDTLIEDTAALAEKFTYEHQWQDGDIILINNHRVLHGRR